MGGGGDGEGGGRDNNSGKIVSGGAGGARLGKAPFGCGANGGGLGEENDEVSPGIVYPALFATRPAGSLAEMCRPEQEWLRFPGTKVEHHSNDSEMEYDVVIATSR